MGLSVEQLSQRYQRSALAEISPLPPFDQLLAAFSKANSQQQPDNAEQLAKWLVKQSVLTRYQAQQLLASESPALRLGDYVLRQPLKSHPWNGWWSAADKSGSGLLLRPLSKNFASESSLATLKRYQRVASPHLLALEGPEQIGNRVFVTARLPAGMHAAQWCKSHQPTASEVTTLGKTLATVIVDLHARQLPVAVGDPYHLWISTDGGPLLLCAPQELQPTELADSDPWFSSPSPPWAFLPPEQLWFDRQATLSDNLCGLGSLLYFLRFGALPYDVNQDWHQDPQQSLERFRRQATQLPTKLVRQIEKVKDKAQAPEDAALLQVLAHALARNPEARFSSASQMMLALEAIAQREQAAEPTPVVQPIAPAAATSAPPQPVVVTAEPEVRAQQDVPATTPTPMPVAAPTPTSVAPLAAVESPSQEASSSKPSPRSEATNKTARSRGRKKKKKNPLAPYVLGGLGLIVMMLMIAVLVGPRGDNDDERAERQIQLPPPPPVQTNVSNDANAGDGSGGAARGGTGTTVVGNDSGLLWAAPQSSGDVNLPLRMLPPGADMIVTFKPDQLVLQQALSPELDEGLAMIQQRIGVALEEVQRMTLAVNGSEGGVLQAAIAVQLKQPTDVGQLSRLWQAEEANLPAGGKAYVQDDENTDAYYVGSNNNGQVSSFAVASLDRIKEIAEAEGAAIVLPRTLNQLWSGVGGDPALAILAAPNFLFADGRQMLQSYAPAFVDPLKQLLIPAAAGFMVRMEFQPQWYVELRLAPGGGTTPTSLRQSFSERLAKLPSEAENFLIQSDPHPSWKALALRLPAMLRASVEATRSGVVDGVVVANMYLPQEAAANVLLAGWLASNTPMGAANTIAANNGTGGNSANTAVGSTGATTVEQLLEVPFSISFDQESLEMGAQAIADQFNAAAKPGSKKLEIFLLGGDLQLDGITQNQQIRDFVHRNQSLSKVLDDLVRRANPDRTATELYQDAQKLIWVVGPHPDRPSENAVLITTRTQAKQKYQMPSQFIPPNPLESSL